MPNRINSLLLDEYKESFAETTSLVAVGYPGLTIEETNALRGQLEEKEIRLQFVKNRIVSRAMQEAGKPPVDALLQGQTAFACGEDVVAVARFLVDFAKQHKQMQIHGALVENTVLDEKGVVDLSKSPTVEELKSIISGQALSPGGKVSGALLGPGALLASQIEKIAEAEEGGADEAA